MFKPFRGWQAFWSALGWVRRNRRQRRAAARRRSVVRRHRFDTLEKRVVLNADAVDDSDPVNLATTCNTAFQFSESTLLANDTGNGTLSISGWSDTTTANGGSISYSGGTFTYTPPTNFTGNDTFSYSIEDQDPTGDSATVTIYVNGLPTAFDYEFTVNVGRDDTQGWVDWPYHQPSAGDSSDPNGNTLSIVDSDVPTSAGYVAVGTHDYEYTIDDGHGGQDVGRVRVNVVPAANQAPTPANDEDTGDEDTPIVFTVAGLTANDTDPESDTLDVIGVDVEPTYGTAVYNSTTHAITYTPDVNWSGSDSFTYTVSDGHGGQATATVSITIEAVNDPRSGAADSFSLTEDTAWTDTDSVLDNDPADVDGPGPWTVEVVSQPVSGAALTLNEDGTFTYTPPANFYGADTFTYRIFDGTDWSEPVTVTMNVAAVQDAPIGGGSFVFASMKDDGSESDGTGRLVSSMLSPTSDPDGNSLGIALTGADFDHGMWQYKLDGGTIWTDLPSDLSNTSALLLRGDALTRIRFVPDPGYRHTTGISDPSITYRVWDRTNESGSNLNGTRADVSTNGGVAPYSAGTASPTVLVYGPIPHFVDGSTVDEDAGTISFTVVLSHASSESIDVDWTSIDAVARLGYDFYVGEQDPITGEWSDTGLPGGTITFAPGETSKQVTLVVMEDDIYEANEAFGMKLTGISAAGYPPGADWIVTGRINNNDAQPIVTVHPLTVNENASSGLVTLRFTINQAAEIYTYTQFQTAALTGPGAATVGQDFYVRSYNVTFFTGETEKFVTVPMPVLINDTVNEGDETFAVNFTTSPNLQFAGNGVVTIRDDDRPVLTIADRTVNEAAGTVTFTATLNQATNVVSSFDWRTVDRSALAGEDYTAKSDFVEFGIGETSKTFTVDITNDGLDEFDEMFAIEVSGLTKLYWESADPIAKIEDDDPEPTLSIADAVATEESGIAEFVVTLSAASGKPVTVAWATQGGAPGDDYVADSGTVVFAPGDITRRIPVDLIDNTIYQATPRTFSVAISSPVNTSINGQTVADATITDADRPKVSVVAVKALEDSGQVVVTVRLTNKSADDVTVDWAAVAGTADETDDYGATAPLSGTLTFARWEPGQPGQPGEIEKTITIDLVDDVDLESDETFEIVLSNAVGATIDTANDSAEITILDDDRIRVQLEDDTPLTPEPTRSFAENGGVLIFHLTLSETPAAPVTFTAQAVDGTALRGRDYVLVDGSNNELPGDTKDFTFAIGETEKTLRIKMLNNGIWNEDRKFTIKLLNVTGANPPPIDATVTIVNDDALPPGAPIPPFPPSGTPGNGTVTHLPPADPPDQNQENPTLPTATAQNRSFTISSRSNSTVTVENGLMKNLSGYERQYFYVRMAGTGQLTYDQGRLDLSSDGAFTFTPTFTLSPVSADSFSYELVRISDDQVVSTATVSLTLQRSTISVSAAGVPPTTTRGAITDFTVSVSTSAPEFQVTFSQEGGNGTQSFFFPTNMHSATYAQGTVLNGYHYSRDVSFGSPDTLYIFARDSFWLVSALEYYSVDVQDGIDPYPLENVQLEHSLIYMPSAFRITGGPEVKVTYVTKRTDTQAVLAGGTVEVPMTGYDITVPSPESWDYDVVTEITQAWIKEYTTPSNYTYVPLPLSAVYDTTIEAKITASNDPPLLTVNTSQGSSRSGEQNASVGATDVAVGLQQGDLRLGFDATGMAYTPTYVGAEQRAPIAEVEIQLPVSSNPSLIKARFVVLTEGSNVAGSDVTYTIPSGMTINGSTLLHFAVPLVNANLNAFASGRYRFEVVFTVTDSAGTHTLTTDRGEFNWWNNVSSQNGSTEFGEGWSIPGTSRILYSRNGHAGHETDPDEQPERGFVVFNGDGSSEFFQVESQYLEQMQLDVVYPTAYVYGEVDYYDPRGAHFGLPVDADFKYIAGGLRPGELVEIMWNSVSGYPTFFSTGTITFDKGRRVFGTEPASVAEIDAESRESAFLGLFIADEDGMISFTWHGRAGSTFIPEFEFNRLNLDSLGGGELTAYKPGLPDDHALRLKLNKGDGTERIFDYDGNLREVIDVNGNRTQFKYYATGTNAGLLEKITEQGGLWTKFAYASRKLDTITDSTGRVADYSIAAGKLTKIKAPAPGTGLQQPITEFDYNTDGLLEKVTRKNQSFGDLSGGTASATTDADRVTEIEYDPTDRRVKKIIEQEGTALERTLQIKPMIRGTSLVRKAAGHIGSAAQSGQLPELEATVTAFDGAVWRYQTDRLGYLTAMAKPATKAFDEVNGDRFDSAQALADGLWTWSHDDQGYVTSFTEPSLDGSGVRTTSYSRDGRHIIKITYADSTSSVPNYEQWTYETENGEPNYLRLKSYRNRLGEITKFKTDDRGNILETTHPDGSVEKAAYTAKPKSIDELAGGLVDWSWDAVHGTSDYVYFDGLDDEDEGEVDEDERPHIHLVQAIRRDNGTKQKTEDDLIESFKYDVHRNVDLATNLYGVVTDYDYDALGQLINVTHNAGQGAISARHEDLIETWEYDALGQLIRVKQTAAANAQYETRGINHETRFKHDELGRVKDVYDVRRDALVRYSYSYVAGGEMVVITTPSPAGAEPVETKQFFDVRGQLVATVRPPATYFQTTLLIGVGNNAWTFTPTTEVVVADYVTYKQTGEIEESWTHAVGTAAAPAAKTKYTYDKLGRIDTVLSPTPDAINSRPKEKYEYRADGTLKKVHNGSEGAGLFRTTTYDYYDFGRTRVVTDVEGNESYRIYDEVGRLQYEYDRRLNRTEYVYDRLDRLTDVLDAQGYVTKVEYLSPQKAQTEGIPTLDARAVRIERIKDGRDRFTWKQYDAYDRVVRIVYPDPDGDGFLPFISDVFQYNADGTLAEQWQEVGTTETHLYWKKYEYDDAGRLERMFDARGTLAAYAYNRLDQVTQETNASGLEMKHVYDQLGRMVSTASGEGGILLRGTMVASFGYDWHGNRTYAINQYGDRTYDVYDGVSRKILTVEPDYHFAGEGSNYSEQRVKTSRTRFDDKGNLIRTELPGFNDTTYSVFDNYGRPEYVLIDGAGTPPRTLRYEYDANGNVIKIAEWEAGADNNVVEYEYDGLNRLHKERILLPPADGGTVERVWDYDGNGNLVNFKDRDGRNTTFTYDHMNRKVGEDFKDPSGSAYGKNEFTFNEQGNLESASSYAGGNYVHIASYTFSKYDERRRPESISQFVQVFGGWGLVEFTYEFDDELVGPERRVSTARRGHTVTASVNGLAYFNSYQFDAAGREVYARQVVVDGASDKKVTRDYLNQDGLGDPTTGFLQPISSRRELVTYSARSGAGGYTPIFKSAKYYAAEDSQLVARIEYRQSGDEPLIGLSGKPIAHDYLYDDADRLRRYVDRTVSVNNPMKFGDGDYSVSETGVAYSRVKKLLNDDTHSIGYDREGHVMNFVYNNDGPGETDYSVTWQNDDRIGRLDVEGSPPVLFYYDAFGRIVAKGRDNDYEFSFYDGANETLRFRGATLSARSFYSAGQVVAIDTDVLAWKTHWTLTDAQQTIRDVVVQAGQSVNVAYQFDFDGFGETDVSAFSANRYALVQYHGGRYVVELNGYTQGGRWSSALLAGRTLHQTSTLGPDRYGSQDPAKSKPPAEFWKNPVGWLSENIDGVQTAIATAGVIPGVGMVFDGLNVVIYAARGKWDEVAFSAVSFIPIYGDALGGVNLVRKAVVVGGMHAAQNAVAQGAAIAVSDATGGDRQFQVGQVIGAGLTGGLASTAGVKFGRSIEASERGLGYRIGALATGTAFAGAIGNAAEQFIDTGTLDLRQVAMSAAFSALGPMANHRAYGKTCFTGDTKLDTPEGHKRIDEFVVGDAILQRDEFDPEAPVTVGRVEEVFVRNGQILELTVNGRVIKTTAEHPFYVVDQGWTKACELKLGTPLLGRDGRILLVDGLVDTGTRDTVYNLRIHPGHTYFVSDEDWGFSIWVHNLYLYHGSRDGIVGDKFDLAVVKPSRRDHHLTAEEPAVFLTDDLGRAATQYSTPRGHVARVWVDDKLAMSMRQFDPHGRVEYVARTQSEVNALNAHLEIKSFRDALKDWYFRRD